MPTWLALVGAYLIGSLDFAVVVARAHGVDIHNVGSGNPGASNVLRTLGKGPAAMVFLGDALKGVIAAALGTLAGGPGEATAPVIAFAAGFMVVAGHCFPALHRFKGGKGVATCAGVLLFTLPLVGIGMAVVWVIVAKVSKVASIASLTAVVLCIPAAYAQGTRGWGMFWLIAMLALVVIRHAPNIKRMISGSEQKVPT
jgi:glycerol-3-phosphate acyltransferase PlsY